MENVTSTEREQGRLRVLNSLLAEHIALDQAAELMGVSPRHTRRILAAYQEGGAAATAHGHQGRRPPNATPEPVATAVVLGSYQIRRGQPHPSQRVAERARRHRHQQDHPPAHLGQRRAERSAAQAAAQTPALGPGAVPGTGNVLHAPQEGGPDNTVRFQLHTLRNGHGRCAA